MRCIRLAINKILHTKYSYDLFRYCSDEDKCGAISGLNINPRNGHKEMRTTRRLYGKDNQRMLCHIIQSFAVDESKKYEPAIYNEISYKWAEANLPDFEVVIFTHVDRDHIHNHVIVNSVSFKTGKKLQHKNYKSGSGWVKPNSYTVNRYDMQKSLDDICREYGLSTMLDRGPAKKRLSHGEKKLLEQDKKPWKEEIRQAIDESRQTAKSFAEMQAKLRDKGIEMYVRGKNVSFRHPDKKQNIRGYRLGEDYTKEAISKDIEINSKGRKTKFEQMAELRSKINKTKDPAQKTKYEEQLKALRDQRNKEVVASAGEYRERNPEKVLDR